MEHFIIQSILMSGFSRILAEKLLRLQDADTQQVLDLEEINGGTWHRSMEMTQNKED